MVVVVDEQEEEREWRGPKAATELSDTTDVMDRLDRGIVIP